MCVCSCFQKNFQTTLTELNFHFRCCHRRAAAARARRPHPAISSRSSAPTSSRRRCPRSLRAAPAALITPALDPPRPPAQRRRDLRKKSYWYLLAVFTLCETSSGKPNGWGASIAFWSWKNGSTSTWMLIKMRHTRPPVIDEPGSAREAELNRAECSTLSRSAAWWIVTATHTCGNVTSDTLVSFPCDDSGRVADATAALWDSCTCHLPLSSSL